MDSFQMAALAYYASKLRGLQGLEAENEDEFYRRHDPTAFNPKPAASIAVVLGVFVLLGLISA